MSSPPRQPLESVTPRRAGSVRRTTNVDIGPPDGRGVAGPRDRDPGADRAGQVGMLVLGAGRQLHTTVDGVVVEDEATVASGFDSARRLVELRTEPDAPWTAELLGQRSGGGFRRALGVALGQGDRTSLLVQLLDDLPAALLISGYSWMRLARLDGLEPSTLAPPEVLPKMTDLCSGWRDGGIAIESVRRGSGVPIQDCPPATDLESADPDGWHAMATLKADWMRRRRCVDVFLRPDGMSEIWAMFRDTVAEDDGVEVVLHEYSLTLVAEPDTAGGAVVRHIEARPSVLPFPECPAAAQAVASLTGENIDRFPSSVPELLTSVRSCTHLNDLLRSVGGAVPAMTARA